MRFVIPVLLALFVLPQAQAFTAPAGGWNEFHPQPPQMPDSWFTGPAISSREQAIGFYTRGRLVNANALPDSADGFVRIVRPRNRHFLSDHLKETILNAAQLVRKDFPEGERMQVADCSDSDGGGLSGHGSHQNGLDADAIYYRNNHQEQDPQETRGLLENFVENGVVTTNFDAQRNFRFFMALTATGRVNRIFVDQAIKREMCNLAAVNGFSRAEVAMLRRLRHWRGHANHMHIRLKCPPDSPRCEGQAEPPAGSGC